MTTEDTPCSLKRTSAPACCYAEHCLVTFQECLQQSVFKQANSPQPELPDVEAKGPAEGRSGVNRRHCPLYYAHQCWWPFLDLVGSTSVCIFSSLFLFSGLILICTGSLPHTLGKEPEETGSRPRLAPVVIFLSILMSPIATF